jgi:hypothetical protein
MFSKFKDAEFRKDAEGRDLYFPWVAFGPGYILESEDQRKSLQKYCAFRNAIVLPLAIFGFTRPSWSISIIIGFAVFEFCYVKVRTRNLVKSNERISLKDSTVENAKGLSWPLLILVVLGFASATALPLYMMHNDQMGVQDGWMAATFFGLITLLGVYQIFLKANR